MISFEELKAISKLEIKQYNKDDLKDIQDFKIISNQNSNEKITSFLKDFGNPYCFICKDLIVKVEFSDTSTTLENLLTTLLIRKKQE